MNKVHYRTEITLQEVLRPKSKHPQVKNIQEWLNLNRYNDPNWKYIVTVDGEYGGQTEQIVRMFQQSKGLQVDGIVGAATFRELTKPMRDAFTRIKDNNDLQKLIVAYAEQHLKNNPKELYNSNKGPWVRAYMDGLEGKEWAWCMGFAQTILDQAFFTVGQNFLNVMPRTFSCDVVAQKGKENKRFIHNSFIKGKPENIFSGDLFLVRNPKNQFDWTHTGVVTAVEDEWIHTIEGNTNDEGSREGFEVCRRMRNYGKNDNIDIYRVTANVS
jgi:hypothetical protein